MVDGDTSFGGPKTFPGTSWSILAGFCDASKAAFDQSFDSLYRRYWKAAYCFLRRKWEISNEDAKDVTEEFFTILYEDQTLSRYKPQEGSFRAYLRSVLHRVSINEYKARRAEKRGGKAKILSLELDEGSLKDIAPDDRTKTPEQLLDEAWKGEVWKRAMDRTREIFESSGRAVQYQIFHACTFEGATHAQAVSTFNVSEAFVRNHLGDVRDRIWEEARAEIRQTTSTEEDFKAEWEDFLR